MNETVDTKGLRINSIDVLRGVIMIIMVLDHARDYFTMVRFDPLDLTQTSPLLFFTRWITHFCAPTFIFLSGVSAYLSLSKSTDQKSASFFLIKRGLWLMLVEVTVIGFGWSFDIGIHTMFLQVIWAIGWSMLALSVMVFLKPGHIAVIGLLIIFGHNALDKVSADSFGVAAPFWMFLHQPGPYMPNGHLTMIFIYPVLPWIGVMAVGYAFGSLFKFEEKVRNRLFLRIGLAALLAFVVLRFLNIYGDPAPWHQQSTLGGSIMSFINCTKYPASLLYILMTIGVSVLVLAALKNNDSHFIRILRIYGRVPMFYYILHIYLLHIIQMLTACCFGFSFRSMLGFRFGGSEPAGWGFGIPVVYLVWASVVLILYFPCRWFAAIKRKQKKWWHSYI